MYWQRLAATILATTTGPWYDYTESKYEQLSSDPGSTLWIDDDDDEKKRVIPHIYTESRSFRFGVAVNQG